MEGLEVFVGLDVHSEKTVGTFLDGKGNLLREMKVPTDKNGFGTLFGWIGQGGKTRTVKAVFEASRNWTYIAGLLREQGVEVVMAHPLKVRAIASARIKTDRIDSRILADLLRANLIPESYMPSDETVELRELARYRVHLGRTSAGLKTRVRTLLAKRGIKCPYESPVGKRSRPWLSNISLTLPGIIGRELDQAVKMLDELDGEKKSVDKLIEAACLKHPEANLLTSIPGVGQYSGLIILSEIGDVKRFPTPEQLASYAGLVSSTYQSGSSCYQGKITKQGNKWLRWILVQCSLVAIRKPNRLRTFYLRLAKKKGHKKAIVATARKMLTIIWHLLTKGETFVP